MVVGRGITVALFSDQYATIPLSLTLCLVSSLDVFVSLFSLLPFLPSLLYMYKMHALARYARKYALTMKENNARPCLLIVHDAYNSFLDYGLSNKLTNMRYGYTVNAKIFSYICITIFYSIDLISDTFDIFFISIIQLIYLKLFCRQINIID